MFTSNRVLKRWCRAVCAGLLLGAVPLAMSCYGHFPLTKAIYHMNARAGGEIGDDRTQHKLVQSVVMWVLIIIPVYEVGMLADALVLNLIEFWTDVPVTVGSVQEHNGTKVSFRPTADGREAVLTISRFGHVLTEQRMVKVGATAFEMRDASGKVTGGIQKTASGGIQLTDARGLVVNTLSPEDLKALPR